MVLPVVKCRWLIAYSNWPLSLQTISIPLNKNNCFQTFYFSKGSTYTERKLVVSLKFSPFQSSQIVSIAYTAGDDNETKK